jgi:hypothetical protein
MTELPSEQLGLYQAMKEDNIPSQKHVNCLWTE